MGYVTAKYICVATGGRPTYIDFEGSKEYCISSDDIFWRKTAPGKTLIIGAGYIALECGGFLQGLGNPVTLMVRSSPLRNFDQDCAKRVAEHMESKGVRFWRNSNTKNIVKLDSGKLSVTYDIAGETKTEEFDTVIMATGRTPDSAG